MIMHGTQSQIPRPLLIVIEEFGGTEDAEMAHWMRRKMASCFGIDPDQIRLWLTESWADLWSLSAEEIAAVVKALIGEPEPPDGVI
ncbi:hypothetical protein D7D52_34075 [Nocardia yunnanensis]|uniref:Uncharacterized protein n=1 Tax=Nocardia yunnanensis TaxID=2382165 RepID=A0A386ZN73_9NOCA|nr:hypothetical protein [Nocardia yunnanensis]AYF78015.1 hypothetical protein D7D52_34075 [Nocardia yunnanensis]